MSQAVMEIGEHAFDGTIRDGIVLVDFWAPWCGPCRMQGPILETVAAAVGDRAALVKVNVDECPSAAERFSVRTIPTLILFKAGREQRRFVGVQRHDVLVQAITEA